MNAGTFDRAEQLVRMEVVEWLESAQQKWLSVRWAFRRKQLHPDMHACGEQLCIACFLSLCVLQGVHDQQSIADHLLPASCVLDPVYLKHDVMGTPDLAVGFVRQTKRMLPGESMANLTSELTRFR